MNSQPLPRITEVKRTLDGREKRFNCRALFQAGSHLVVLFIAPVSMHVHGVNLPAGTVTFGHFWTDRPYNVYQWLNPVSGTVIGTYVNLCDDTRFADGVLEWLDLVIDILVLPDRPPVVLDEDELPAALGPRMRARIDDARTAVFSALNGDGDGETIGPTAGLIAALEKHRAVLWPIVQGHLEPPP